jgi:type II secretory pathway pseudopilin PulG
VLRRLRSDGGFTIIEASVSVVIMGILLGAVFSVIMRVQTDATDQIQAADAQRALRDAAHDLDVELRQAIGDDGNNNPVKKLAWDEIQFTSYLNASADLQLHKYFLSGDCSTGCTLKKSVYPPIPSSDPPAYSGTATFTSDLVTDIIASPSNPAFVGQTWTSGTSPSDISACNEAGSPSCDFSLVEVSLRADPTPFGAVADVVIVEQVRIRNAR